MIRRLVLGISGVLFVLACWAFAHAADEMACVPVNAKTLRCQWFPGEVCYVRGEQVSCIEEKP